MIKMKKSAALILAGVLACSMPMPVMASSDTEVVESLLDSGIDFLASDPGKAVDIIMSVSYTHLTLPTTPYV